MDALVIKGQEGAISPSRRWKTCISKKEINRIDLINI